MNAAGPVLRDIHLPPPAWWPPAPGWWLLAGLVALVAALAAWWWTSRRASRGILRRALHEIDALQAAFRHDGDAAALAAGASRLLRRVARRVEPSVAAMHGEDWHAFLRRYVATNTDRATLENLSDAAFRERPALDADALPAALRGWCRRALRGRPRRPGVSLARGSASSRNDTPRARGDLPA